MDRLKDKLVLITGAAGAVGKAVAEAVKSAGGVRHHQRSGGFRRGLCARRHVRARLARVFLARSAASWPARRAGQRGGARGARHHRRNRLRDLAAGHVGQSRRHIPRLQARAGAAQAPRRLDRQCLVGGGPDRRPQLRGLQRLQGRGAAAQQIGSAAWRAARSAGALQFESTRPSSKGRWSTRSWPRPTFPKARERD